MQKKIDGDITENFEIKSNRIGMRNSKSIYGFGTI